MEKFPIGEGGSGPIHKKMIFLWIWGGDLIPSKFFLNRKRQEKVKKGRGGVLRNPYIFLTEKKIDI